MTKVTIKNLLNKAVNRLFFYHWRLRYDVFRKKYDIADDFVFNGPGINFYGEGRIIIGRATHVGSYSTIQAKEGFFVEIGENCRISHNVRMYTSSAYANQDFSLPNLKKKQGNVVIGNHVWIGVNTYIGPGIVVGDNAVVGANSVVTKNVEPNTIVGGVPARIVMRKDI